MSDLPSIPLQLQHQYRLVRALQTAVYAQPDPSADADLYQQLTAAEAVLHDD